MVTRRFSLGLCLMSLSPGSVWSFPPGRDEKWWQHFAKQWSGETHLDPAQEQESSDAKNKLSLSLWSNWLSATNIWSVSPEDPLKDSPGFMVHTRLQLWLWGSSLVYIVVQTWSWTMFYTWADRHPINVFTCGFDKSRMGMRLALDLNCEPRWINWSNTWSCQTWLGSGADWFLSGEEKCRVCTDIWQWSHRAQQVHWRPGLAQIQARGW